MGYWARAKNGEPMALWQRRQWQMRTLVGRPRAWKRTWPHRQPPSRTTSSAISISFSRQHYRAEWLERMGSPQMTDASARYPFATPPDFGVAAYANNDDRAGMTRILECEFS